MNHPPATRDKGCNLMWRSLLWLQQKQNLKKNLQAKLRKPLAKKQRQKRMLKKQVRTTKVVVAKINKRHSAGHMFDPQNDFQINTDKDLK